MKQKEEKSRINESNKRLLLLAALALAVVLIAVFLFKINSSNNDARQTGQYNPPINSGEPDFIKGQPNSSVDTTSDDLGFEPPRPRSILDRNRIRHSASTGQRAESRQKPDRRQELYEAALSSSIKIGDEVLLDGSSSSESATSNKPQSLTPSYNQANTVGQQETEDNNRQTIAFKKPLTPYTLLEGTLIEASLQTGISSALPGDIIGIINRDVYDSINQNYLIIPRGSRIIGTYDSGIAFDQRKMMLSWDRVIFPDGRSITLPAVPTHDLQGMSGLGGDVNTHFWKIFGQSAMLSLIGAGASVAVAPERSGLFGSTSARELIAGQIAQDFQRVANTVFRRNLNRQPTIEIPAGTQFNIFILDDIAFKEPYTYRESWLSN